jgi:hypothetical protein
MFLPFAGRGRPRRGGPPSVRRWAPALAALLVVGLPAPAALAGPIPTPAGAPTPAGGKPTPADVAAVSLAADRGIPLAQAQARMVWQAAAPGLADTLSTQAGYGGVWIDPADGDRVKVGVVGGAAPARAAATAAGLAGAVDVVPVRHSMAQLEAANGWLSRQLARVNPGAAGTLTAGLRPDRNAVELLVPAKAALTPAQQAVLDSARARFGAMLLTGTYAGTPVSRACSYPYCDPPLRAGVRITNAGVGCTAGFLARSRSDNKLYQFTAGHCALGGHTGTWSTAFANREPHAIGAIGSRFRVGSAGDEAVMAVANPAGWQARAWVYVTASPFTARDEQYTIGADGGSVIGMRICTTGAFYGRTDCGVVQRLGVTVTYSSGQTVTGLGEGNICGTGGDSGAPVYANHIAYGLQVAGFAECGTYFQGIRGAENALNVDVAVGS